MKINKINILYIIASLVIGVVFGWLLFNNSGTPPVTSAETHVHEAGTWTCSMHPQIRQNEAGKCPICGMDLIPVEANNTGGDPGEIVMSETAIKLAQVQTIKVGAKSESTGTKQLRLNGKIQADERRLSSLTAHIPGRIEELKLNFTGEQVKKGQLIARIYSPELLTAQKELLEASKFRDSNPALFNAAKEKLYRWKISEPQVEQIISNGQTIDAFPIYAEASGVVQARLVNLGDYVQTGDPLYEIQNLTNLWVVFDAYESDLQWISIGSKVSFTVAAIPGKTFETTVSYIDPLLEKQRRVANVRGEISNSEGLLKPEMFVLGRIEAAEGPEATSTGLSVPRSAVLWTGERSVVYIQVPSTGAPVFKLRQVKIGTTAGDDYVVTEGLQEGDEVVVNGAFTIDAAAQLAGKPSMMNAIPEPENAFDHSQAVSITNKETEEITTPLAQNVPATFRQQFTSFVLSYLDLKNALVEDLNTEAQQLAQQALAKLTEIDMKLLTNHEAHMLWMDQLTVLQEHLGRIKDTGDIESQRAAFKPLSESIIVAVNTFGVSGHTLYQQYCPMADENRGADWLSLQEEILNPYFGDAMLSCGSVEKIFEPVNN